MSRFARAPSTALRAAPLAAVAAVIVVGPVVGDIDAGLHASRTTAGVGVGALVALLAARHLARLPVAADLGGAVVAVVAAAIAIGTGSPGVALLVPAAVVGAVAVTSAMGVATEAAAPPDGGSVVDPTTTAVIRRPAARSMLPALVVGGMLAVPAVQVAVDVVRGRTGATDGSVVAVVLLGAAAGAGVRRVRSVPLAGSLGAAVAALTAAALVDAWVPAALLAAAGAAATAAALAAADGLMRTAVPGGLEARARAVAAVAVLAGGAWTGALLLPALERRHGHAWALALLALPAVHATLRARHWAPAAEPAPVRRLSGAAAPLLECRNVDFAYGRLQVLFGVDLTVDEGELVALLGVNGAGKSTLLRAICGLGYPTAGTIALGGRDITYLDAEERVALGVSMIPGGRAVFGDLSVVDNLRAHAHTLPRSAVEAAMDDAFATFPRLAERRDQLAASLSGGEQQMLALSKALILRPRLLLVDELSLGLAPAVVGQLLDAVRAINVRGTAVVVVEQSVNVALELARHAYFMERGAVRFDGASEDLLERPDLLRSVFLEGAAAR